MNKVCLVGRLTKDVDLRYSNDGNTAIARFSIAVQRQYKKDEADFINCIAFKKTGEIINQYFVKGNQIALEGRIQTGSYERDGIKHYTTDIIVDSFDFINSKNSSNNDSSEGTEENVSDDVTPVDDGDMPF